MKCTPFTSPSPRNFRVPGGARRESPRDDEHAAIGLGVFYGHIERVGFGEVGAGEAGVGERADATSSMAKMLL